MKNSLQSSLGKGLKITQRDAIQATSDTHQNVNVVVVGLGALVWFCLFFQSLHILYYMKNDCGTWHYTSMKEAELAADRLS